MTWQIAVLMLAFICFALAAFQVAPARVNLVAAGLALWMLTLIAVR